MSDFHQLRAARPQISFDEANIILMNIRPVHESETITIQQFLLRLENLLRHTPDSCLCGSIQSLLKKVDSMTQHDFDQLCYDSICGKIMFPANYSLPSEAGLVYSRQSDI